jgi:hypothetical protein
MKTKAFSKTILIYKKETTKVSAKVSIKKKNKKIMNSQLNKFKEYFKIMKINKSRSTDQSLLTIKLKESKLLINFNNSNSNLIII